MDLEKIGRIGRSGDASPAGRFLRRLGSAKQGGLEAENSLGAPAPAPSLSDNDVEDLVERFRNKLDGGPNDDIVNKRAVIIADGEKALKKLRTEGVAAELSEPEEFATEAVIIASGERPTIGFVGEALDFEDASLGQWDQISRDWKDRIEKVAKSVGRINLNGRHVGTGWVIAPGRIMTNRHVLQGLATHDGTNWAMKSGASICFDGVNDLPISSEIVYGGDPAEPRTDVDFAFIDAAVLSCSGDLSGRDPLIVEESPDWIVESRNIYACGFPAKPLPGQERFAVLMEIFQMEFGVKRYAPGEIDTNLGTLAGDPNNTVFSHDCSTLAGNSGSPLVDLGNEGKSVVGLHFAGLARHGNFAHSMAALKDRLTDIGANFA